MNRLILTILSFLFLFFSFSTSAGQVSTTGSGTSYAQAKSNSESAFRSRYPGVSYSTSCQAEVPRPHLTTCTSTGYVTTIKYYSAMATSYYEATARNNAVANLKSRYNGITVSSVSCDTPVKPHIFECTARGWRRE